MTETEQTLLAMNAALIAAIRVALAAHPAREVVIRELEVVAEQTEAFQLNSQLHDKAVEASRSVFSSLIQSLKGDQLQGQGHR